MATGSSDPLPRLADALGDVGNRLREISDELRGLQLGTTTSTPTMPPPVWQPTPPPAIPQPAWQPAPAPVPPPAMPPPPPPRLPEPTLWTRLEPERVQEIPTLWE